MDAKIRETLSELRQLDSRSAADWIMANFPRHADGGGVATTLIPHLSWKRADQDKLANEYLQKLPHASAQTYEAFASFMTMKRLIAVIEEHLPVSSSDLGLLLYYLAPTLKKHTKSQRDTLAVASFLDKYE